MQSVNINQYRDAIVNCERAFLLYIDKGSVWIIAIWRLAAIILVAE